MTAWISETSAPKNRSTSCPSFKKTNVGISDTLYWPIANPLSWSTSTSRILIFDPYFSVNVSKNGMIYLHGLHQSVEKSTTTNLLPAFLSCSLKSASLSTWCTLGFWFGSVTDGFVGGAVGGTVRGVVGEVALGVAGTLGRGVVVVGWLFDGCAGFRFLKYSMLEKNTKNKMWTFLQGYRNKTDTKNIKMITKHNEKTFSAYYHIS